MANNVLRFVDSISATPTTRLDLNDGTTFTIDAAVLAPPPRIVQAVSSNAMTDGGYQSTTRYDSRVLQLSLLLNVATQEAAATALQNLHRELDRSTNFLKWQPDTLSSPVFFRTWRTSPVEVVGVPAARAVYRILLEIPADPFARGLLETINVGTVNTATGYFDVATASIKGDVEAPILLLDSNPYIGTGPGSANATLNWLLARSTRSATSQPSMVQCSTLTMGTDTAVSATDALTTFTTTSSATRLTWSPTGATAAAMNGRYRLMVGATITATTSSATFTISAKYGRGSFASFNAPTSFSETVTPTGTQKYLLDFGIIDFSEALTATLTLAPRVEIIAASTSTTVTKTILWDFLYLVPADEALALTSSLYLPAGSMPSGGTYPTTNPMIYDGDAESVQIVSSTSIFTTATAVLPYWAQYNGSIPAIKPGSDNRFFYMRYASGITATPPWSEYSTSGSGTLTLYYYPLYLYVRPATT
jgi:hypothetical protein